MAKVKATEGPLVASVKDASGNDLGTLILVPKVFSTGNVGWYGTGKFVVEGRPFQGQAQLAAIREKQKGTEE